MEIDFLCGIASPVPLPPLWQADAGRQREPATARSARKLDPVHFSCRAELPADVSAVALQADSEDFCYVKKFCCFGGKCGVF
jgi:hypothetical protein